MRQVLVLVAVGLLMGACSGGSAGKDQSVPLPPSNATDVEFLTGMIPHHEQALEMAELAAGRAESDDVKDLARRIEQAQRPEITQLKNMLRLLGAEISGDDARDGGAESGGSIPTPEMDQLRTATGSAFDKLFLELMVRHHATVVAMADKELGHGEFPDARNFARGIKDAQQSEIAEMRALLDQVRV